MATNENWPRWIVASISQHFYNNRGSLPLFIEGQYRDTRPEEDFIELRIDGPWVSEVSHNNYKVTVEVNVLVQSKMNDTNYHRIHTSTGIVLKAFTDIILYKYGSGVGDDSSQFGCLTLEQGLKDRERVQVNHFGQIESKTDLMQATVEGRYHTYLTN